MIASSFSYISFKQDFKDGIPYCITDVNISVFKISGMHSVKKLLYLWFQLPKLSLFVIFMHLWIIEMMEDHDK